MKILQLCKKFPFPLKDGESIAITNLARALDELGNEVTLLAMNTTKHWTDPALLPDTFDHYRAIHTVDIDNRLKPGAALRNLFSDRSYHIERFDNQKFEQKLIELLRQESFDLIQLETLYLAPYLSVIRKYSTAMVALRAHNVEHEIWERIAANSHPLKRWYLNAITPRLKKYETERLNQYDLLIGITERDVQYFRRLGLVKPAMVTPIGIDSRDYMPDYSCYQKPLSLAFIGSLDWMPNVEGLKWFLDQVWTPLLATAFPQLRFHIAGRNTPAWLHRLRLPGVTVHGEVPDAAAFINQHPVMVAPLLSGGGMRAKILEGMALGRVVLSTPLGLEGIHARHLQEALIAETPQDFLNAVKWCIAEGPALQRLGEQAQNFCFGHFDNLEVARQLMGAYRNLQRKEREIVIG